ncbi:MAG: NADH-quinone oxidoreductase subunit C, partial [Methanomassiliicoccaceae archaeon]|nr:NADH-quinone oxidoreductase subunit C [Methanomassiliicoccaceae archaeon]
WVDHMQVVYHLSNYYNGVMIEINVDVPNDDPHIDSVALIWEGADWHERETYELFGIIFDGHPKLERLLTPQNYEFFPFKKSYKLRGQQ